MKRKSLKVNRPFGDNGLLMLFHLTWLTTVLLLLTDSAVAEDWPTYMHDNLRSSVTDEQLVLPLQQVWVYHTPDTPRPAWAETPATQDLGHGPYPTFDHKSRVLFDRVFSVVVSGYSLYFGSSSSDKVTCLNARTGVERWKYLTGGPVRFAPTLDDGKIYFGSDDGYVYCLSAARGSLIWKKRASPTNKLLFANGQLVSVSPVRTSVLVQDGVAYWAAGVFPELGRYLYAANASTGELVWTRSPSRVAQGYLLSMGQSLYVPAGKTWPVLYEMSNGDYQKDFTESRQGGCYALIMPKETPLDQDTLAFGPCYSIDGCYLTVHGAGSQSSGSIGTVNGNFLVVKGAFSYYSTDTQLFKVERATQQVAWSTSSRYPHSLILAGDILFAGGIDEVAAFSTATGEKLWSGTVEGTAHGLAAANGCLYVSTDHGRIYAFGHSIFDLNRNNTVDVGDLAIFADEWLACTNPNNDNCVNYLE